MPSTMQIMLQYKSFAHLGFFQLRCCGKLRFPSLGTTNQILLTQTEQLSSFKIFGRKPHKLRVICKFPKVTLLTCTDCVHTEFVCQTKQKNYISLSQKVCLPVILKTNAYFLPESREAKYRFLSVMPEVRTSLAAHLLNTASCGEINAANDTQHNQ